MADGGLTVEELLDNMFGHLDVLGTGDSTPGLVLAMGGSRLEMVCAGFGRL